MHAVALWFLLLVSPALAGDFTGTWALDAEASDSVEPLLIAQGVPGWKRKLAAKVAVTQVVDDRASALHIRVQSSVKTQEETLQLDGVERDTTTDQGAARVSHRRTEDGAVLTTTRMQSKKGEPTTLLLRRHLEDDGKTMVQKMTLTVGDDPAVEIKRVFRRQDSSAAP